MAALDFVVHIQCHCGGCGFDQHVRLDRVLASLDEDQERKLENVIGQAIMDAQRVGEGIVGTTRVVVDRLCREPVS